MCFPWAVDVVGGKRERMVAYSQAPGNMMGSMPFMLAISGM